MIYLTDVRGIIFGIGVVAVEAADVVLIGTGIGRCVLLLIDRDTLRALAT